MRRCRMGGAMTERLPTVVIGAGHNGLVCAAYLARAGRKVLVLESSDHVGGAAVTREFAPGFRVSAVAHLLQLLDPVVERELQLARHGLQYAHSPLGHRGAVSGCSAAQLPGRRDTERPGVGRRPRRAAVLRAADAEVFALHRAPARARAAAAGLPELARRAARRRPSPSTCGAWASATCGSSCASRP